MDLNIKLETFSGKKKTQQENILEFRVFKEFLDLTTKAQSIKTNKWDIIKLKIFTLKKFSKGRRDKKSIKDKLYSRRKYLQTKIYNKGIVYWMYK